MTTAPDSPARTPALSRWCLLAAAALLIVVAVVEMAVVIPGVGTLLSEEETDVGGEGVFMLGVAARS